MKNYYCTEPIIKGRINSLNKLIKLLFVTILLLITPIAKAQLYPVQVSVSTTPPYYNFLSHYGDQNNHLLIIATLTDFNSPPINARLRLKIEGQGFVVQTRQDIPVGNVFTLEAGFPVFIQGSDVLPLLQESNLAVVSGNPNLNNLLEGFTTICVEVVEDGANQTILATNNCTAFFLQLMQPPQAFLPICNSIVDTNSMFQTFQWSPPQNYIPSIGTDLNYTFSLYEWIDTTNYNIFQTGQGLVYQTQTPFAMAQVSNFDVLFQKGVKYIWRVQAELTSNGVPVQMITNNGISAPCSFYYGQPQTLAESLADGLVINLTCDAPTSRKGRASWTVVDQTPNQGLSGYNSYKVEIRRKPRADDTFIPIWHEFTESGFQQLFYQVVPEETYQVRVSGVAGDFVSEPTEIVEFTTPASRQYACGEVDLPYLPATYQPLVSAHMGDAFQIGQFTIEVTSITPLGTLGHYKGRGTIPHGFIGGARIKVQFDDLLVDTEYHVREGQASAITEGLDNWLNEQYLDQAGVDTTLNGVIESGGFLNDSTVFVVVNGDSLFFNFNGDLPIVIHGANNVEYQFWSNGTMVVTTYGVTPSTDSLDATRNLVVRFESISADPVETNLFDKKSYDQFSSSYEAIICQSNSPENQFIYFVSNKSKEIEGTAQVKAIIHVNTVGFVASGLSFKIAGGLTVVPHTVVNDSTFLLTLPAKSYNYSVYAMYDVLKLGKLNVKCYAPITKKVTVVPLVSMSLTETQIETALNTIYKGANLSIDATIAPQFNTPEFTTTTQFANPDVSLMSKYTAQMRALREAYLETSEIESGTYLVFIVPSFENSQLDGYMVRGRGVGFIAQSTLTSVSTFSHTLAHELGHGIGGLQHAWGDNESLKNGTDNLMDYSSGTRLIKEQWEALRNPSAVISLFDGEEDGSEIGIAGTGEIPISWFTPDNTISFFTVGKSVAKFSNSIKTAFFNWGINDFEDQMTASGTLYRFSYEKNGVTTDYKAQVTNGIFEGYKSADGTWFTEFATASPTDSVIIALPNRNEARVFAISGGNFPYLTNSPVGQAVFTVNDYNQSKLLGNWTMIDHKGMDEEMFEVCANTYFSEDGLSTFSFLDFDSVDYSETYLTYTKIAELRSSYPDIFNRMTDQTFDQWDDWTTYTSVYASIATTNPSDFITNIMEEGYFDYCYVLYSYGSLTKNQVIHKFLLHFKELIDINRTINEGAITDFNEACTGLNPQFFDVNAPDHPTALTVKQAVEAMSVSELSELCTPVRVHLMGILLNPGIASLGVTTDSYERAIDKLFWTTPNSKHTELLEAVCTTKYNTEIIIKTIVDAVDDQTLFIGENYNTKIMNWVLSAYANYDHPYKHINPQNITATQLEQVKNRIICYNYTGFVKRLCKSMIVANSPISAMSMEGNQLSTVAVSSTNEKVYFVNETVMGFSTVSTSPTVALNLLDPVILDDNANLLNIYAENGGGKFAPAIVLYFLERKADAKTTVEAIQTAVDVATFLIPGAQTTMALRILNYADKASSVASVLANATAEDYPELSQVLGVTSLVLGIADFSTNGVNSLKNLGSNPSNAVNLISRSENVLSATNHAAHVDNLAMRILSETPDQQIVNILTSANPRGRAFLERVLETERYVADGAGEASLVAKLDDALDLVRMGTNAFETVRGVSRTDFLNSVADFSTNPALGEQAWILWKNENWVELEQLFNSNNLNNWNGIRYPPNDGFINKSNTNLIIDFEFDRYGGAFVDDLFVDNGKFVAPNGASFPSRALPEETLLKPYKRYRVIKEIPQVNEGQAIPWFGQIGNGMQYKLPYSIDDLKINGYIIEIP